MGVPVKEADKTSIGGPQSTFLVTRWSQIEGFGDLTPDQQRAVLAELISAYWKPVYCYLRRKGYDNEKAKDLTQGFFQDIVLGRHLVEQATSSKGRFRTLLLTALDRYVISLHRYETAWKRGSGRRAAALDDVADALAGPARDMDPDEAFTYAWACDLLQQVVADVESRCLDDGRDVHWRLFFLHIVEPILTGEASPGLGHLCTQLGVATPVQAENMIVTVKRRFQAAMRSRVREYVVSEDQVDQEIRDLMEILAR
jgi:RNA polymerase sigma-70 factor (ECF subfamily)